MRNLIIIKHSNDFITAYGNNKTLYVKEGQSVKAGQLISYLGDSNKNKTHLHFEMRKHGKPVNPIKYLPKFS
jgi:lipoprotein NlpD